MNIRNSTRFSKPTDDELAARWKEQHPNTIHTLGGFRRYREGIWVEVPHNEVRREILKVLVDAKHKGVRPTNPLINSVTEIAMLETMHDSSSMDPYPNRLVFQNGTLDLNYLFFPGAAFRDHQPNDWAISSLPYNYDPSATAPTFMQMLSRLPSESVELLQEFAGLCLTKDTRYEIAIWLVGPSGSGKSAIISAFQAMAGGTAVQLSLSELERSKYTLAKFVGKRLIYSTEQNTTHPSCLDILNKIISGEVLQVEEKFQISFEYRSCAKIIWASSNFPYIPIEDGLFRRFKIIELPPLSEGDRDPDLKYRIEKEAPGILNWAIEGWKRLQERGRFQIPPTVRAATLRMQGVNPTMEEFLAAACERSEGARIQTKDLHDACNTWMGSKGYSPLTFMELARELDRLGYQKTISQGRTYRHGLKLRSRDESRLQAIDLEQY